MPDFFSRLNWFVKYRNKLGEYCVIRELREHSSILLSLVDEEDGHRPVHDGVDLYRKKDFKDLILFYEYFHGENSRGVGASHQTGWTGVIAELIDRCG